MRQKVFFEDLGVKSYKPTWEYQEELLLKNTQLKSINRANDQSAHQANTEQRLLMVEHPPVFTLGKSGKREHVLVSEEQLQNLGIEFYHINRGGDITYHGLQQIVGYPILDLDKFKTDLGWYLRCLEEVIIQVLAEYGLKGAMHGFALNVNTDLSHFEYIVPCGIQGKAVTSLEKELGRKVNYDEVKQKIKFHFEKVFDCDLVTS